MSWEPSQIVKEFDLKADPNDLEVLIAELRELVLAHHPDRTGGSFPNALTQKYFYRLKEAIDHLESTALVQRDSAVLTSRVESMERVVRELAQRHQGEKPPVERPEVRRAVVADVQAPYRKDRLQSGMFSAACAAIIGFSQVLRDNPVFGWIAGNQWATSTLLGAFGLSASFFILSWIKEERVRRLTSWLLTEHGLRYTIRSCLADSLRTSGEAFVTKSGIVMQIAWHQTPWHRHTAVRWAKRLMAAKIPALQTEQIAEFQLTELIRRDVLKRIGSFGIEPRYTMQESSVKELLDDHSVGAGEF